MQLYVIRHGEAVERGANGAERDEDRELTEAGRAQSRAVGAALRQLGVKLDTLLTSPLTRARQTADEVLGQWPGQRLEPTENDELAPGRRKRKLLRELLAVGGDAVAIVGHNPDLSELVGWLLGEKEVGIELAKAGVARIDFEGPPNKGAGLLVWVVTPAWCELAARVASTSS
jgi:phosphohistidine phosphatase